MNFSYQISYQNKQQRTVTVVFTPEDPKALAVAQVLPYQEGDSDDKLRDRILAAAPLGIWQEAVAREDVDFALGTFTGDATAVQTAVEALSPAPDLERSRAFKMLQIDEMRLAAELQGMAYTFPDGSQDVIQMRNERDIGNISGLSTSAVILKSQGVADPVFSFRAASNVSYSMTPDEIIAMGIATSQFMSGLYQIGWGLKEQARQATSFEELDAIVWPQS